MLSFEEFIERSDEAATAEALRVYFQGVLREEGFENFILAKMVDGKIRDTHWVSFPDGHFENYLAEGWQLIDPVLAFTARAIRPFMWEEEAARMRFAPAQLSLLEECRRVGVHSLIVTPHHGPDGSCNLVGISRRHAELPDPKRVRMLQAICTQVWCRYSVLTGADLISNPGEGMVLTRKELEVLRWLKDGKSNSEISSITSLSIKTVEYHVGNILRKLGASNRTTAVVIALQRQLLPL